MREFWQYGSCWRHWENLPPTPALSFKGNASFLFQLHNCYFFQMQHGGGRDAGLNLGLTAFDAVAPVPVGDSVFGLYRQVDRSAAPLRQDPFDPVRGEKFIFMAPNGSGRGPAPLHITISALAPRLDLALLARL